MRIPPARIVSDRLVLRCWSEDAEPEELKAVRARLASRHEDFVQGRDFFYLIFDPSEQVVLGSTGLHPRVGPEALEIGYWVRTDQTGRGLATEAARAMTRTALDLVGAQRIEIRCDPQNLASAAIPRRLGYDLRETISGNATSPQGEPRDTMVWEMMAARFEELQRSLDSPWMRTEE